MLKSILDQTWYYDKWWVRKKKSNDKISYKSVVRKQSDLGLNVSFVMRCHGILWSINCDRWTFNNADGVIEPNNCDHYLYWYRNVGFNNSVLRSQQCSRIWKLCDTVEKSMLLSRTHCTQQCCYWQQKDLVFSLQYATLGLKL